MSLAINLHWLHKFLEGLEDGTEAALVNLDQFKAFDRGDHRFWVTVLENAGFQPEFCKWISMMYHNQQAEVQVNEKLSEVLAIERSVRQGCSLSPLFYEIVLEPCSRGFGPSLVLSEIPFTAPISAKVSAYADNISVFVSRLLDIKAVKKVVARYDQLRKERRFGARFLEECQGLSVVVTDPSTSLGCDSSPGSNWSEIGRKYWSR